MFWLQQPVWIKMLQTSAARCRAEHCAIYYPDARNRHNISFAEVESKLGLPLFENRLIRALLLVSAK